MNSAKASATQISNKVQQQLLFLVKERYFALAIVLVSISYGALIGPTPPNWLRMVYSNTFFKIFFFLLVALGSQFDFMTSLFISTAFILGTNVLSNRPILESYNPYTPNFVTDTGMTILNPQTAIEAGCNNITLKDLYAAFENDALKLQNSVKFAYHELLAKLTDKSAQQKLVYLAHAVGLPYNVDISDANAPYIATILIQWGFNFGPTCNSTVIGQGS